MHEGHDQRVAVPPGPGDERGLGRRGPADLAAEVAPVGAEHRVLVEQLDRVAAVQREHRRPGGLDPHELRHGQRLPGEQGQVVGGGVLALGVEPVGPPGHGVVGLEPAGLGVHQGHALAVGPGRLGEGDRRVVGGNQQQGLEQVRHPVRAPLDQAYLVRGHVRGQPRGHHGGVWLEHRHQRVRGEYLQGAGRQEVPVRVLGRQYLPGPRVRDHVGGGVDRGQPPGAGRGVVHDDTPPGEFRAAHHGRAHAGPARLFGPGQGRGASRCSLRDLAMRCAGRPPGGGLGQRRRCRQGRQGEHRGRCGGCATASPERSGCPRPLAHAE